MGTRKQVIREGDIVRVLKGRTVRRVGYPLGFDEAVEQLGWPVVLEAADAARVALGLSPRKQGLWDSVVPKHPEEDPFLRQIVWEYIRGKYFGGSTRSIHWTDDDTLVGLEGLVVGKRVVKTGDRYPASVGWEDYEPGGLDNCQTHVLVEVSLYRGPFNIIGEWPTFHRDDIELISRGTP